VVKRETFFARLVAQQQYAPTDLFRHLNAQSRDILCFSLVAYCGT
jgi:hypothetical protein